MPIPRCCANNALVLMGRSGKQAPTQTPTPQQKHLPHNGQNIPPTPFTRIGMRHTCLRAACAIHVLDEKRPGWMFVGRRGGANDRTSCAHHVRVSPQRRRRDAVYRQRTFLKNKANTR